MAFRVYQIRRIFTRLLKNSASQKCPEILLFASSDNSFFPSLYLRNDDAEITRRFRTLLSPLQPPFKCLDDVAVHAEHLLPSQPTTSVAFEDFVSQRKSSCPSLSQRNLQQQHPTFLVRTALQHHLNQLLLLRTSHTDNSAS